VAFADVNNDGHLDLYTGTTTSDPAISLQERSEVMLGDGQGGFSLGPSENPLRRPLSVDVPAGASFADFDRDGNVDLFVSQHNYTAASGALVFMQDVLWKGDGEGSFDDATLGRGLATEDWNAISDLNEGRAHTRAWGANACDLNNDGFPELLVSSYGRSPNHLWQAVDNGDGDVSFVNRGVPSGYAYDEDLSWQDNQFARCHCQANPTAEGCTGAPAPQISCSQTNWTHGQDREAFRLGGNSGTTVCADLNNDGFLDLFTTEIKHWWAGEGADGSEVLLNTGEEDVRFERPGDDALGLAIAHTGGNWDEGHMTAAIFDFDNDGNKDIYLGASDYAGNRGRLYHQEAGFVFSEVAPAEGIDHHRSHGVISVDLDRDGDLDLVVGHSRSRCDASGEFDCYETSQVRVFENTLGEQGNWISFSLEGIGGTNRAAIGARVEVKTGDVLQVQEVEGGHGHYGIQNGTDVHFGLGEACEAEITVLWPDAKRSNQTFSVQTGYHYRVKQGEEPKAQRL
jgi:hypothetical protein